ncbi:MAG: flagellar export chaperone FlgN [Enterobacteriaceae bacterium]|jgi:flagella synthesis protein FlgN|nr:flagellar export chaperone FlgN [Enterobacteriaceae bacterium]
MKDLQTTLMRLQSLLEELESTLLEEIKQLSQAQVNPVSLQVVSDSKSRSLSAINFYDEQRKQAEKQRQLAAPYSQHPKLAARWNKILHVVKHTSELNQQSFQLLEIHMKKMNELKKLVQQAGAAPSLYGENGDRDQKNSGNSYHISV